VSFIIPIPPSSACIAAPTFPSKPSLIFCCDRLPAVPSSQPASQPAYTLDRHMSDYSAAS
jgi:hypothetical protein